MAEFTAAANLDIVVTPDSLRSARRTIERELGDVEVGVGSNRPTGSRGAVGARGPEPAGVDLSRRQLGQQETLVELAGERNELLEELLEGADGGGGGALRTAGVAGLGARALGIGGGVAGAVASPFAALALLTLGTGAAAAATTTPEERRRGNVPVGPGPGPGGPSIPTFDGRRGGPAGARGGQGQPRPDRPPRQGGTISQTTTIDATANVQLAGMQESEVQRFVNQRIRQAAENIKNDLESLLGSGTGTRTFRGGGPSGARGGEGSVDFEGRRGGGPARFR